MTIANLSLNKKKFKKEMSQYIIKIYSYELTPILECLIPDKNIVYSSATFAKIYWTHIKEGGDPNDF